MLKIKISSLTPQCYISNLTSARLQIYTKNKNIRGELATRQPNACQRTIAGILAKTDSTRRAGKHWEHMNRREEVNIEEPRN